MARKPLPLNVPKRKTADEYRILQEENAKLLMKERINTKYDKHFDKKMVQRAIKDKLKVKLEEYEKTIEIRRDKYICLTIITCSKLTYCRCYSL